MVNMRSQFNIAGKLEISISRNLSQEILTRIHNVVRYLHEAAVEVNLKECDLENNLKIVIKVLNIGNISDKQMKEVFDQLIPRVKNNSDSFKLIHQEKEFWLPDDIEECLDWFVIEE